MVRGGQLATRSLRREARANISECWAQAQVTAHSAEAGREWPCGARHLGQQEFGALRPWFGWLAGLDSRVVEVQRERPEPGARGGRLEAVVTGNTAAVTIPAAVNKIAQQPKPQFNLGARRDLIPLCHPTFFDTFVACARLSLRGSVASTLLPKLYRLNSGPFSAGRRLR